MKKVCQTSLRFFKKPTAYTFFFLRTWAQVWHCVEWNLLTKYQISSHHRYLHVCHFLAFAMIMMTSLMYNVEFWMYIGSTSCHNSTTCIFVFIQKPNYNGPLVNCIGPYEIKFWPIIKCCRFRTFSLLYGMFLKFSCQEYKILPSPY